MHFETIIGMAKVGTRGSIDGSMKKIYEEDSQYVQLFAHAIISNKLFVVFFRFHGDNKAERTMSHSLQQWHCEIALKIARRWSKITANAWIICLALPIDRYRRSLYTAIRCKINTSAGCIETRAHTFTAKQQWTINTNCATHSLTQKIVYTPKKKEEGKRGEIEFHLCWNPI